MARTDEQNAKIRDKMQTKIIYASIKPLALKGLNELTVDDVTKGCGCSHGLFYHYFPSTERLYSALTEYRREKFKMFLFPAEELEQVAPKEAIRMVEKFYANIFSERDTAIYMARIDIMYHTNVGRKDLAKGPDVYKSLLSLIKRGQENGDFVSGDAKDIATAIVDAIAGALSRRLLLGKEGFKAADTGLLSQFLFKN